MAVGDKYELVIVGTALGQQVLNTLGFEQVAVTAGLPQAHLASYWNANLKVSWKPMFSSAYTITGLWVNDVVPGTAARYELAISPAEAGGGGADILPMSCAAVASFRTLLKGRSFRGRQYLGCITETNQADSKVAAGWVTLANTYFTALYGAFVTNAVANSFAWSIISRESGGAPRTPPIATPVSSWSIKPNFASQRRRSLGVGA